MGIDPGLTGAVAVIDKNGKCLLLSDCPTEKKSLKKIVSPHGVVEFVKSLKKRELPRPDGRGFLVQRGLQPTLSPSVDSGSPCPI